jgi:hypothetical protein
MTMKPTLAADVLLQKRPRTSNVSFPEGTNHITVPSDPIEHLPQCFYAGVDGANSVTAGFDFSCSLRVSTAFDTLSEDGV